MLKRLISIALLFVALTAHGEQPNLLFIMMDDLGYGHCEFHNDNLTVNAFDPYFKELVAQRQDYSPEQALDFSKQAMPTLSKLGRDGVVFTQAYSASSLCAPARLSIATGRNLQNAGVYSNVDVESRGLQPGTHLAHKLQDAGYATAHIGKWHMAMRDNSMIRSALDRHGIKEELYDFWMIRKKYPEVYDDLWSAGYYGSVTKKQNPLNNGFDYYYGYNTWASQFYDSTLVWENFEHAGRQSGYNTEVFTDKALGFIKQQVKNNKPFFVQLHYHAVHDYLQPNAPDRYFKRFPSSSYDLSNFYAHVYAVDYNIQRMVNYLKKNGLYENTLIVFTSDNGAMTGGPSVLPGNAPFSGHKGMFRQGGIRVPLLFHWPANIKTHAQKQQLVSSMDIMPTIIEAAGLEVPGNLEAKSLLPMLTGNSSEPVRDQMIWSGIHARRWGHTINKSFKSRNEEWALAPGGWAILKGDYLLRFTGTIEPNLYHEFPTGSAPGMELYNIRKDPAETQDLKDQMPELVASMKAEYRKKIPRFKPPINWNRKKWKELVE